MIPVTEEIVIKEITMSQEMTIEEEYVATHPKSQELFRQAKELIPSGISHDGRYMTPFAIYMERGEGSKLWDVDGNEYIDYHPGMASQLLGHRHPAILAAIGKQLSKGIEFGSCDEMELRAAELIIEMVPCAEQVRFTGSGAEANMLAIRLARAYTGKDKVIRFRGSWHGGFGKGLTAVIAPFDLPYSGGLPRETFSNLLLADHNSADDIRGFAERGDIACVLMEPGGAHTVVMPNRPGFLEEVSQITKENGIVLIFDEVATGFRSAPGGIQELLGVTPDLVTLGKSMSCGMAQSAVAGKKEIMEKLAFTGNSKYDKHYRVRSQGTHSGSPLILAVLIANLEVLKTGEIQARINRLGSILREGLNEKIKKHDIRGCVYGHSSTLRIFLDHDCPYMGKCDTRHCSNPDHEMLDRGTHPLLRRKLSMALYLNGIYLNLSHWILPSGATTEQDIEKMVEGFNCCIERLKAEKAFRI